GAEDDDPARFWSYVVAAIRRRHARFGDGVLAALRAPGADPADVALPRLANELGALPEPVTLVLDDYQRVRAPRCPELLDRFPEHLPETVGVGIAPRRDPPLAFGRLRLRGELFELRAEDLRFTEAEAAALLAANLDGELAPAEVAALVDRTEGWVAG